jgi:hypothetical protein
MPVEKFCSLAQANILCDLRIPIPVASCQSPRHSAGELLLVACFAWHRANGPLPVGVPMKSFKSTLNIGSFFQSPGPLL